MTAKIWVVGNELSRDDYLHAPVGIVCAPDSAEEHTTVHWVKVNETTWERVLKGNIPESKFKTSQGLYLPRRILRVPSETLDFVKTDFLETSVAKE